MDPRMNEYDGCQSSYQGCEMDQGMNGSDGYHSSFQDGGFGYDEQQEHCVNNQEAYTNNQGSYHHHQWNNNFQDPISFSSQHQEPCSSSSQYRESSLLSEAYELLEHAIKERKLLWAYNEKLEERVNELERQIEDDKRVLDGLDERMESPIVKKDKEERLASHEDGRLTRIVDQREENERVLDALEAMLKSTIVEEVDKEEHLASHENEDIIEEASAKGDSNEPTSKTLIMEKDIPKVNESLQALLGSDDMGEFLSKVEHLKFILDNKDMLGEVLHKYEEEQCSNIHMRALFKEAPSMEKKETVRSEDVIQVENVVKTTEAVKYDPPLVVEQRETLQPLKQAKRKRRKKPNKTKGRGIEPKPPLLTFTPLRFIDGKLECKVSSKGRSKPFSRVKILLPPGSKEEDWSAINEAMVKAFSMKLGDRGPLYQSKFPIPPNG